MKAVKAVRAKYGNAEHLTDEQVREAATTILEDLHADLREDEKYPLPVVTLLKKNGFKLYRAEFRNPKQAGLLVVDSALPEKMRTTTDRAVFVNRDDPVPRQRQTSAKLFAHYIFDFDEKRKPVYYKKIWREAI